MFQYTCFQVNFSQRLAVYPTPTITQLIPIPFPGLQFNGIDAVKLINANEGKRKKQKTTHESLLASENSEVRKNLCYHVVNKQHTRQTILISKM